MKDEFERINMEPLLVNSEPVCTDECSYPCRYLDDVYCCVPGLRQQRDEWRRALQSLTPQGSDDGEPLCETPEECVKYVRELKRQLDVLKRNAEWNND